MSWLKPPQGRQAGDRWVVVDVETSGLDPQVDQLVAIAAVALRAGPRRIEVLPGDSFEVVVRPDPAAGRGGLDKANVLLHGIGIGQQRAGVERAEALRAFDAYADGAPRIAFHAAFDRAVLRRAASRSRRPEPKSRWVDLADLAPVLHPGTGARALDDWLALFGIECLQRHQAAADALATAELLQRLWPRVVAENAAGHIGAVARLAARRHWLPG